MDHMTQSEITVFTLFYTFLDGNCLHCIILMHMREERRLPKESKVALF